MNHLRPVIPSDLVALVDALVQSFNRRIDCAGPVLLNQVTRCIFDRGGHWRISIR
jgi:hypothetical protein